MKASRAIPSNTPLAGVSPARPAHSLRLLALAAALLFSLGSGPLCAAQPDAGPPQSTVNINKADAVTLAAALSGVGLSRAEDIVRYREQFGPFTTVDQLSEVKGIGSATVEKNRPRIKLD